MSDIIAASTGPLPYQKATARICQEAPRLIEADDNDETTSSSPLSAREGDDMAERRRQWRERIDMDARKLYGSDDMQELWSHFGQDVDQVRANWALHTSQWIEQVVEASESDKSVKQQYRRYIGRFHKLIKAMKLKKLRADFGVEEEE